MSRTRHNLPTNLNPEGSRCYPLFVPDDDQWVQYVTRAIRTLTMDRHWERDDDKNALIVREIWDTVTYQPLIDAIYNDDGCGDDNNLSTCFRMDTSTEAFTFYPNDPFSSEPGIQIAVPLQWKRWENTDVENTPIFQTIEDIISFLIGYYPNDCILVPSNPITNPILNWSGFLSAVTSFPFPYCRIDMQGTGQFEVELVNVPFGCSAWIIPDVDITSWQGILEIILEILDFDGELPPGWIITEVDRDISIPPEIAPTQTQEIEFKDAGEHSITIVYVPRLDDEIPFIFPFGGVREMEACGQIKVIGSQTGEFIGKNEAGQSDHKRQGVIGVSTVDDICQGVLCALGNAGAYILAAINSGASFTIDSSGEIVIDTGAGGGVPTTQTGQEQLNGSANQAFAGINEFIEDFADFYSSTGGVEATMEVFLTSKWLCNAGITQAVIDYVAYRDIPQQAPDLLDDGLIEDYFCKGIKKTTTAAWIIDNLAQNQELLLTMVNALSEDQYSAWIVDGADNPDSEYLGYDCYRRPTFEFEIDASVIAEEFPSKHFISLALYFGISETRNLRFTVSGKFVAPTGEQFDILYWRDDVGTIAQQGWQVFGMALNNGDFEVGQGPPPQLPYSTSGDYSWIASMPGNNYTTFAWRVPNFSDNWQETVLGKITVKIEDAGQAI